MREKISLREKTQEAINNDFKQALLLIINSDGALDAQEKIKRQQEVNEIKNNLDLQKFADKYDYGDKQISDVINHLRTVRQTKRKIVAAESILTEKGLKIKKLPTDKHPNLEDYYKLAADIKISRENFIELINKRVRNLNEPES